MAVNGSQCELGYIIPRRLSTFNSCSPARPVPAALTAQRPGALTASPQNISRELSEPPQKIASRASASSPNFFFLSPSGLWRSTEAAQKRESFARRIELAANPPKKDVQAASCFFSSTASAAQPLWCLSEEHPDRPTRAPGGPCDLNLFLSSTTK